MCVAGCADREDGSSEVLLLARTKLPGSVSPPLAFVGIVVETVSVGLAGAAVGRAANVTASAATPPAAAREDHGIGVPPGYCISGMRPCDS
jgi:hypothetical protein